MSEIRRPVKRINNPNLKILRFLTKLSSNENGDMGTYCRDIEEIEFDYHYGMVRS